MAERHDEYNSRRPTVGLRLDAEVVNLLDARAEAAEQTRAAYVADLIRHHLGLDAERAQEATAS